MTKQSKILQYLEYLKINGVEVLVDSSLQSKIENNEVIRCYVGCELSGGLHIGHMISFLVIATLAKFKNTECYILFSKKHALLNLKTVDYKVYEDVKSIKMFNKVNTIFSSSDELVSTLPFHNFMNTPEYIALVEHYAKKIRVKKLIKSLGFFDREHFEDLTISKFTYPLYQAIDISYLNIDLAIGGSDQRKIHMLHNDNFKEKCSYIHTPMLEDDKGMKVSKSLGNTFLDLDKDLATNFRALDPTLRHKLNKLLMVSSYEYYTIETLLDQITPR